MMSRLLLPLLFSLLVPTVTCAQVRLVVSITPLRLIAEEIIGKQGSVRVLVPVSGSPHHYTMTPSDRLALESADLILYVGEPLETELHEALGSLGRADRVIQLLDMPGLERRQLADSEGVDPHIWLDSRNGLLIAAALRDALSELEASQTATWQENYRILEQRLRAAEERWQTRLQAAPDLPYAVYHDAIGYFEARYGRRHSVVLLQNPELQPGIRQLMSVRRAITEQQPVCLFTDVTARQNTIDTLFEETAVRQTRLDLLGERISQEAGYPALLENLVEDFSNCLSGGHD